ncbi:anthranilate synthase component I family protein [Phenylobacterium sp.]|jgi:para-aminobenzoate synthetase component 1|uniref:anthranilate synthase component I family protein n=1 Tax=Phenylobacterium sp. TaxID=1871053 RepID=UPI002F3EB203
MQAAALVEAPWRDPGAVLSAFADEPWALGLVGGGADARWAYLARQPDRTLVIGRDDPGDAFAALAELAGPRRPGLAGGPPFQGGVAGLACYELGDRVEPLGLARLDGWPDLACARYPAILAFDQAGRRLWAVGRGADEAAARGQARRALGWLGAAPQPPGAGGADLAADDPAAYERAVAEVVERIAAGEIFQANIARRWRGRLAPGGRPFDVFARLAEASPAPFASYLRLAGRAVASNSPERFLALDGIEASTRPIKGTTPRGADAGTDRALAEALAGSAKDRAENLMIVDLMRNDLARVCEPGTVAVPQLFAVESFANVHHLVSTVRGRLAPGRDAVDLLRAAFPPGSITGAPKVQAMRVIARLEAPRGPFFGAMFRLGFDGNLDSSVLIRTAAFVQDADGWRVEARAGAGVVADSEPSAERAETEAKIAAVAAALRSGF